MLNYKKPAFWVVVVVVIASLTVVVCLVTNLLKDDEPTNIQQTTTESVDEGKSEEPSSEESSKSEDSVKEESTTKKAENTTKKTESTTKKADTSNKTPSGKITYTTDSSVLLKINNSMVFSPQDSYVAVKSPELKTNSYFKRSVINKYTIPNYYDSSTKDAENLNKAIELQKEFYWIRSKANSLGIKLGQVSYFAPSGMSFDEERIYGDFVELRMLENKITTALVNNGTLKINTSRKNELIRKNCYSDSFIIFEYRKDIPQEIIDNEIAIIRNMFGADGLNSDEEFYAIQNKIYNERVPHLKEVLGYSSSFCPLYYTLGYNKANSYPTDLAITNAKYNVVKESHKDKNSDTKTFFINIYYDPVDQLSLDEASQERLNIDAATPDYISYKKRGVDQYSVTLNKDGYINQVKKTTSYYN
ncbi:MAG: hypothetical protein J6Q87_04340 [Clostridia bacterium]|nr:hypothetical protein [Clostridia bacterium]